MFVIRIAHIIIMKESDLPFNATASSHQRWNENIQR
jgi:hypothetical protein